MKALVYGAAISLLALNLAIFAESCGKKESAPDTGKTIGGGSDSGNPSPPTGADTSLYQRKYGRDLVYFAEVDKASDYYRRMFIDTASASMFKKNNVLPDNTMLFLETWFGTDQSTVYVRQKRGSEWTSDSFSPSTPRYDGLVLTASCNSCHATATATEDMFTLPLLKKALARNAVQKIVCNQSSFTPCELDVYQGN